MSIYILVLKKSTEFIIADSVHDAYIKCAKLYKEIPKHVHKSKTELNFFQHNDIVFECHSN